MNSLIKNSQVFLLFTTLILVTIRNSYLGMDELINISLPLAIIIFCNIIVSINFNPRDLLFFILGSIVVVLSVCVNYSTLHLGGYNSAAYTILLLLLLSISLKKFNLSLFKKLLIFYLIIVSGLGLYLWYYGIYFEDFFIWRDGAFYGRYGKMAISFFLNPNTAGGFFLFCFLLTLFFIDNKYLRWLLLAVNLFLILFSYSRGSMFALLLSLMFYLAVTSNDLIKIIKLYISSFLILVFSCIGILYWFPEHFKGILFKLTAFGSTNRIILWEKVIDNSCESIERILFGSGPSTTSVSNLSSHNSYINEYSNLGLFFILIILLYIMSISFHAYKEKNYKFLTFLIAALCIGMVESSLFVEPTFLWFGIIMIKLLTFNNKKDLIN